MNGAMNECHLPGIARYTKQYSVKASKYLSKYDKASKVTLIFSFFSIHVYDFKKKKNSKCIISKIQSYDLKF